jgi:hypothetical protein
MPKLSNLQFQKNAVSERNRTKWWFHDYRGGSRPLALSTAAAAGAVKNRNSASTASPRCVPSAAPPAAASA